MEKYAKFEVPAEVLGDFVQEVSRSGFTSSTTGPNRRDEYIVSVAYDKEQEEEIEELEKYLDDLCADAEAEDDDEDEDDED